MALARLAACCVLSAAAQPFATSRNATGAGGGEAPRSPPITAAATEYSSGGRAWVPGLGSQCDGIWSRRWSDDGAAEGVRRGLEAPLRDVLDRHECPFGTALPGDVTWPRPPDEVRDLVAPLSVLKVLAVFYAYLPYALGAHAAYAFARQRGTRQLWQLLWLVLLVACNECVFKRVWTQPRPGTMLQVRDFTGRYAGSCLRSCGMPSSHAAIGAGWFLLLFLDGVYRVRPFAMGRKTQTLPLRPDSPCLEKACTFFELFKWVPWSECDLLTHTEFAVYVCTWFVILMPIPFMRVVLYDHSFVQVAAGSCMGVAHSLVWWRITRNLQRKYRSKEGELVFFDLIVHNYKFPQFHITGSGDIDSEMPDVIGLAT